jgi:hypothetical protein
MVTALNHSQLLLHRFEPIISIHWLNGLRKGRWLSALKLSKTIPRRWGRRLRLSNLHVDQGLLHGMKHLGLHNQHWQVDILVVLPVVVVVAGPFVVQRKYKC